MTVSEEDVTGLVTKLNGLALPQGQRELLDAILKVVADIHERLDGQAFSGEFNDAFTKKHADLVLEYVTLPPDVASATGIFEGDSAIIRNPHASPPGIIKNPHPDGNDEDGNEGDNNDYNNEDNDEDNDDEP